MKSIDNLQIEAESMLVYIQQEVPSDAGAVSERLSRLCRLMARSGVMLAEAKSYLNEQRGKATEEVLEKLLGDVHIAKSVQSSLIDSACRERQMLVDKIERLNASITHQSENLRSLLAYYREELSLTRKGY